LKKKLRIGGRVWEDTDLCSWKVWKLHRKKEKNKNCVAAAAL
jgi:hypothetical protein